MKQITTREKAFLSIGVLVAVVMLVWFVLLPMLNSKGSEQKTNLEEVLGSLEAIRKLTSKPLGPMVIELEKNIREQSGYEKISFKRGSVDPAIIRYIAQAASEVEIKELEQLDARLDTSRRSQTEARSQQDILKSIVDQLYMKHVLDEVEQAAEAANIDTTEDNSPDEQPDPDAQEGSSETPVEPPDKPEEPSETPEEFGNEESSEQGGPESIEAEGSEESVEPGVSEEPEPGESAEDVEQAEPAVSLFPPIPKDIPVEIKQSLAESVKARQGKTLMLANINEIVESAKVEDEDEIKRVERRLQGHSKSVKQKKDEIVEWLGNVGISQTDIVSQRMKRYTVKMVFKSKIGQLVRFLYKIQDSARWLKVESMRIGIADRKETTLSVELSMSATVLYGLETAD
jgi:hypothetical protein